MDDVLGSLIPQPVSVRRRTGSLILTNLPDVHPVGQGHQATTQQATATVRHLLAAVPWPDNAAAGPACSVGIDSELGPEAYHLEIQPAGIVIRAGDAAGAAYAAQTIRQLLPDEAWRAAPLTGVSDWQLPCAEIEDRPALSWRGAHIDVARHFVTKRELLAVIDGLAALKLNRLHLHLTDDQGWRIESRLHPRLHEVGSHRARTRISLNNEEPKVYEDIPHGGYYTLNDLGEIAAYAGQRGMALVPEIDLPGHCTALLAALPELGSGPAPDGGYQVSPDWGIFPYLLAPLPESMRVLHDVFGELLSATGSRFVHIGGDECLLDRWRDDQRIEAVRRDRGLATADDLHASFLRDVADMLAADFAARSVVWDEGFSSSGGRGGMLRPDTVVMAWRGMQIARQAALAGHEVVAAPVLPTYFDYYQERAETEPVAIGGPVRLADVAAFAPVPADWPPSAREHLIGAQFQVWTEYIRDGRSLEYMIFPRACALADVAWSGGLVPLAGEPGRPPLTDRIAAHLRRLDAAGLEYRPLDGPRPWQQGGAGPRRHRPGYLVQDVAVHLDQLAADDGA
ncbi:MAG TPA: beta-N-acetylhexosaminidase [Streptosporangiaceae bacterium]|nr:beta-N-acetylhexosaminidase [Streptosporangiaceae bacterium]